MKPEHLQIKAQRKPPGYEPMFHDTTSSEVYPNTTTSGNSHSRSGSILPASGVSLANQAVRCIVNLLASYRLLEYLPPTQRGTGHYSLSPIPLTSVSQFTNPRVVFGIRSDRWADALFLVVDKIGYALPYVIGGCIAFLLLSELIRRMF